MASSWLMVKMLLILIGKLRLEGSTVQVQFDDTGGGECLLRQVGKEEFVDHACTGQAHRALLLASLMGGHHHAAGHPLRPHQHLWAIIEAASDLAFWTLL